VSVFVWVSVLTHPTGVRAHSMRRMGVCRERRRFTARRRIRLLLEKY
jgi:hypothetical protein